MIRSPAPFDAPLDSIETEALHHFARTRKDDPVAQREMRLWMETSERHRAAYEDLRRLWNGLETFRSEPVVLEARHEALDALRRGGWRGKARMALAASLLLAVGLGATWALRPLVLDQASSSLAPEVRLSTRVGQIQTVVLADGSKAILDAASAVSVRIGQTGERRVTVTKGRALFQVAKMPKRPFIVTAGPVAVTALGTRFDVYSKTDGVEVNLLEGRLRVAEAGKPQETAEPNAAGLEMDAGDNLQVRRNNWLLMRGGALRRSGWSQGQLVYDQTPVIDILAELSRYTNRKLVISDDAVGRKRISAVIRVDNPLMFLDALETMGVARVRKLPEGYLIGSVAR